MADDCIPEYSINENELRLSFTHTMLFFETCNLHKYGAIKVIFLWL